MSKVVSKPSKVISTKKKKRTKEELEEQALKEQTQEMAEIAQSDAIVSSSSEATHFAEASTAAATAAVVSDATLVTGAAVASSVAIPTWAYVAGGVALLGGVAAAAGGGGGGSSAPATPSDTSAPAITSTSTATAINENSGAGQVIYTATATDNSTVTYSLKAGSDAGLAINATTGAVTLSTNPDYETKPSYNFTVITTDSSNNKSEKAVSLAINDIDENAPLFTSPATATTAENVATTTAVYTAVATDDSTPLSFALAGLDAGLFDIDSATGAVTFKTSPDFEAPADIGADNIYDFTITATDTAGNHSDLSVALSVTDVTEYTNIAGDAVIDLGSYGKLIAPVQVDGKWFYFWDRSGDGTSANTGALNGGVDYTTHDVLDGLFNHDINGVTNTTVANTDGVYGTTNVYRYGEINGVKLALPTTGTGNTSETSGYYLSDNQTYTDLAEIWDSSNAGYQTSGTPAGWQDTSYWSATPSTNGHALVSSSVGYVGYGNDYVNVYVALQVL